MINSKGCRSSSIALFISLTLTQPWRAGLHSVARLRGLKIGIARMKIALFGHGAMGKLVEERARARGDEAARVFTSRDAGLGAEVLAERLGGLDAAIDFSVSDADRKSTRLNSSHL